MVRKYLCVANIRLLTMLFVVVALGSGCQTLRLTPITGQDNLYIFIEPKNPSLIFIRFGDRFKVDELHYRDESSDLDVPTRYTANSIKIAPASSYGLFSIQHKANNKKRFVSIYGWKTGIIKDDQEFAKFDIETRGRAIVEWMGPRVVRITDRRCNGTTQIIQFNDADDSWEQLYPNQQIHHR